MTEIEIAREHVIAAALGLVASRTYIDSTPPGAFDDAELELGRDMLDRALHEWLDAVVPDAKQHVIQFDPDGGWVIKHPLSERLHGGLFECSYTWRDQGVPEKFGRFVLLEGNVLGQEVK